MVNYINFEQTSVQTLGGVKTFYFDDYDTVTEKWEDDPAYMVDNNTGTLAATFINSRVQLCDSNTCTETSAAEITKVEIRAFSVAGNFTVDVRARLRPVFLGGDGDVHEWLPPSGTSAEDPDWSNWFDITDDTNAPDTWAWSDVTALDVDHYPDFDVSGDPLNLQTGKIEIRATYAPIMTTSTCTMIAPEDVLTNHAQNIREMNMWNGERIVFGESRSKWSLLLKGQDWENETCNRILCLKQQGETRLPIILSGLNNINWDGEWMIKSIGWKLVLEKPLHYKWIILLEKT